MHLQCGTLVTLNPLLTDKKKHIGGIAANEAFYAYSDNLSLARKP